MVNMKFDNLSSYLLNEIQKKHVYFLKVYYFCFDKTQQKGAKRVAGKSKKKLNKTKKKSNVMDPIANVK